MMMKRFTLLAFTAWMQHALADDTFLRLSDFPSLTPSQLALAVSDLPSLTPSQMAVSDFPSVTPSLMAVSDFPSLAPTSVVVVSDPVTLVPSSLMVSDVDSDQPSIIPTISDTSTQKTDRGEVVVLSDAPSLLPSDAPSVVPSDAPSVVPSDAPSVVPTLTVASPAPTLKIDRGAIVDSDYPSLTPSDAPSVVPSDAPSMLPTVWNEGVMKSDVPSMTPTYVGGKATTVDAVTFESSVDEVMDDEQVAVFEDVVATEFLPEFLPKVYPAEYKNITCSVLNQDMLVGSERRHLQEQTGNIEIKTTAVAILMQVKSQVDLPEGVSFGDLVSQTFGSYSTELQGMLSAAMPSYFNTPTNSTNENGDDDAHEGNPRVPAPAETYDTSEDDSTPWFIVVLAVVGGAVVAMLVSYIILDQKKKRAEQNAVEHAQDEENVNYIDDSANDQEEDETGDYDDHDDTVDYDDDDDDDEDEDTRKILGEGSHDDDL